MSAEAEANAGTRKRMKFRGDHDATGMLAKGRAEMASRRLSRDAGILRASADRVSSKLGDYKFRKDKGRSVFVDYVSAPVAKIFTLDIPMISAGDIPLMEDVHLAVLRDAKIRVAGRNTAHCWRDGHRNGDRSPSLSLHRNRARCFVCDADSLSTIDLVIAYRECSLREATAWICARSPV